MRGRLNWSAAQAPRFHNYRAHFDEGTLFLDHPDRKNRIGVRYQPCWRDDSDLATCIRLATGPDSEPRERAHAKALLGIQGQQGWFADLAHARIALEAAVTETDPSGAARLIALGFKPWPRPARRGRIQGYRRKGPRGARYLVLAGPDLIVLRYRRRAGARVQTLMRIAWRTCKPDRPLRIAVWPTGLRDAAHGLVMAAAIAHHLIQKDLS